MNNKKSNQTDNLYLVQKFVEILKREDLQELEYENQEFKIKISKRNDYQLPELIKDDVKIEKKPTSTNKTLKSNEEQKYTNDHPGAVKSPMVGTAYVSAEPGKEPFVKLNSTVSKGDTLLILEAMKVMNSVTAPKSGKITFIGFEDGQPIEFDQLLIIIE